jgi:hypothetical protein
MLASLDDLKRSEVLSIMPDADRAATVVAMGPSTRAATAKALGRGLWNATMKVVRADVLLAVKFLMGLEIKKVGKLRPGAVRGCTGGAGGGRPAAAHLGRSWRAGS